MQTAYYTTMHFETLQASFLLETNVYLLFLAAILDLASRWTPNIILTQKRICHPTISRIRDITIVCLLDWSKSRNSTNLRCYFGEHLGFGIKMTPKHNFITRNGFVTLKLVGLEVLLQYRCYIGKNLEIPQIQDVILAAILDLASRWPPNMILSPGTDSSPQN